MMPQVVTDIRSHLNMYFFGMKWSGNASQVSVRNLKNYRSIKYNAVLKHYLNLKNPLKSN